MDTSIKNVISETRLNKDGVKVEVKHFALRLPAGPDFEGDKDESAGLTRLRAMSELLTGQRHTIHSLICDMIENAAANGHVLPFPKLFTVPTKCSMERFDVRLTQEQIDLIDALRAQLKPQPGLIDLREYYNRSDVVRELLKLELNRVELLFGQSFVRVKD
jgi:hypothetical protein